MGEWVFPATGKGYECYDVTCTVCPQAGMRWVSKGVECKGISLDENGDIQVIPFTSSGIGSPTKLAVESPPKNLGFGQRASDYRTQKARGVNALRRKSFRPFMTRYGIVGDFPSILYTLPHDGVDLCTSLFAGSYPKAYFARPCPTVPRHGFVESRVVESKSALEQVVEETLAQDPNGEVLIMQTLSGHFSAVAHNSGITWAYGNDGVTGGGFGHYIPCPVDPKVWADQMMCSWDSSSKFYDTWQKDMENCTPYVELVEHRGTVVPVQVRAGPPQSTSRNYIPRLTTMERIIQPQIYSGDSTSLLKWEKQVADELKRNGDKPDGLVVYSKGMSLASHWAIHAIQAGIVVITDVVPVYGSILEPTEDLIKPLTTEARQRLAKRIKQAQDYTIGDFKQGDVILTAMASCHGMTFWDDIDHLQNLRALAIEMVTRFVASACVGEARHFYTSGPGRNKYDIEPDPNDYEEGDENEDYQVALADWNNSSSSDCESYLPWEELFGCNKRAPSDRASVYERMLVPMNPAKRKKLLKLASKDFRTNGWGGGGDDEANGCSYGGPKWAAVCNTAVDLATATENFLADCSRENWDKLQVKLNFACHIAHNGGGVLTKWVRSETLGYASTTPTFGLMNYFAGWFTLHGFGGRPSDHEGDS